MRLRPRSFTLVIATIAAALISTVGTVARAAAGECAPGDGVTVVVDFAAFGEAVDVGCAPGSPPSGFEALGAAGFEVTRVQSNPGFVCRLHGLPDAANEDCQKIPPATAFWSYWTAVRGGDWRLSQTGASAAPRGDYEGWTFSSGSSTPPRFSVPAAATTSTNPTPTSTPPTPSLTTPPTSDTTPTTTSTSPTTTGDGGTGSGGSVLAVAVIAAGGLGASLVSRHRRREQSS